MLQLCYNYYCCNYQYILTGCVELTSVVGEMVWRRETGNMGT